MTPFNKKLLSQIQQDREAAHPGMVQELLGLIWVSRNGLTEEELVGLLSPALKPADAKTFWNDLKQALGQALNETNGLFALVSDEVRAAVEELFIPDQDAEDDLRLKLADHLEHLPASTRTTSELAWQLKQAEACGRLRTILLDIDRFLFLFRENGQQPLDYWNFLGDDGTLAKTYLAAFDQWAAKAKDGALVARAANELSFFLHHAGATEDAEKLLRKTLVFIEKAVGPDHPDIASTLNNLAVLYLTTQRLALAEPVSKRVAEIMLKVSASQQKPHPFTSSALNNYAAVMTAQGKQPQEVMAALQVILEPYGATISMAPPEARPAPSGQGGGAGSSN